MTDHTPRAVLEVLTAEEERKYREWAEVPTTQFDWTVVQRLFATLDAARGSSEGPGLREALDRIEDIASDTSLTENAAFRAIRETVRAALTADRSHEGLDVERLARAVAGPWPSSDLPEGYGSPLWQRAFAEVVAHRYARLATRLRGTPE